MDWNGLNRKQGIQSRVFQLPPHGQGKMKIGKRSMLNKVSVRGRNGPYTQDIIFGKFDIAKHRDTETENKKIYSYIA